MGSLTVQEIWVGYCRWTMARTKDQHRVLEGSGGDLSECVRRHCACLYMCVNSVSVCGGERKWNSCKRTGKSECLYVLCVGVCIRLCMRVCMCCH